ncbi:TIGR01440 family protein [Bacillus sp. E214]|uniref:TIGR01440 family protein n=1 Tax=Bacillus sp. E214 TaxID=2587156 RepID=UPI0011E06198|nr:TIGR01440 family protein [Bacillus sp. E214]
MSEINLKEIKTQVTAILEDLEAHFPMNGRLLVIGCSTSEVIGKRIGTSGTMEVAQAIFEAIYDFSKQKGVYLAFQGCEHINRALIIERKTAIQYNLDEVSVVPARNAGGALAACAFANFENAVVVEHIRADAGIDIGDTMIGMHLKHVAVPLRSAIREIGKAHVTFAMTRPKLIGGPRAQYDRVNIREM